MAALVSLRLSLGVERLPLAELQPSDQAPLSR
jgi:hypothetical protein